jgi:1-pyrroline-5-carboxylate dehydrogenase
MSNAFFIPAQAINEPVFNYAPGSPERKALQSALENTRKIQVDIPMYIGADVVRTGDTIPIYPPHDHQHLLGHYHRGTTAHVELAIKSALSAKDQWSDMAFEARAAIFLKAAALIAGPYRFKLMAATMMGQSKNTIQTELDAACEMVDFLRFNVQYMTEIYKQQPNSTKEIWNRTEHRALEGFVFALTPFNFTAIAGNLPTSAAMMGNTVVWKPANTQIYSAQVLMEIFIEAGLPPGVINLIFVSGQDAGKIIFKHPDFAGIHFTGSTAVFQDIWKEIGNNIHHYKNYPRVVGETGGKDFILAHPSANVPVLVTALSRGAFEYQGQKCSAASRAYIPDVLWQETKNGLLKDLASFKMGPTDDLSNFINAVIDAAAFDKIVRYIENARTHNDVEIIAGGKYDKSKGYFIEPTVLLTSNPEYITMCEEIFGPVLTIYVYKAEGFEQLLDVIDKTSSYALTGAIIAQDRNAIEMATHKLRYAAGNFYINDKCTGAIVGQQPFGGARKSGTNDKAGSMINLLRWTSARTIKEVFVPPVNYRYPFLEKD